MVKTTDEVTKLLEVGFQYVCKRWTGKFQKT
jgi:hypothetical protein